MTDNGNSTQTDSSEKVAVAVWGVEFDFEHHDSACFQVFENLDIVEFSLFSDLVKYLNFHPHVRLVLTSLKPGDISALSEIQRLQTMYPHVLLMAVMEERIQRSAFIDILREYSVIALDGEAQPDVQASKNHANQTVDEQTRKDVLTPRQEDVLKLLMSGRTDGEIAKLLDMAEPLVQSHCVAICRVLGVSTRAQAIARARLLFGHQRRPQRYSSYFWFSLLV